ncbi:MAG: aminoacyl-tRNA hydrolase [Chloroflexi bacterium]|nr:aminoacyl-tRNA hydrolase [Chloroflexota bacterium]
MIVGLGNPGPEYARSRHNVGFMVLDCLAARHGLRFNQKRAHAKIARGRIGASEVTLAEPRTYMNLSGNSVQGLATIVGVRPRNLLVVYDDLDLPLGTIRIRPSGGPGTHNGMRSIVECLGSTEFPRLRFGIGSDAARAHPDFVLARFQPDELPLFDTTLMRAVEAIELALERGLEAAMNQYNG